MPKPQRRMDRIMPAKRAVETDGAASTQASGRQCLAYLVRAHARRWLSPLNAAAISPVACCDIPIFG